MSVSLVGKTALVTGSSQGIGYGMLRSLAAAGADVVMHGLVSTDELKQKTDDLQKEFGVKTSFSTANVRKPQEIRDMIKKVQDVFSGLDILCNNVGVQSVHSIEDFPEEKWDLIMDVCLNSAFHSTKAALPYMLEQKWGRIINTGSMHALVASPYKSAYNAAKHGIAGFTKTVGLELAEKGNITCNCICPGYVLTDLIKNQLEATAKAKNIPKESVINDYLLKDQPTKKFVRPEEIGALVRHLCSDDAQSFQGACISIDGGWTAR